MYSIKHRILDLWFDCEKIGWAQEPVLHKCLKKVSALFKLHGLSVLVYDNGKKIGRFEKGTYIKGK